MMPIRQAARSLYKTVFASLLLTLSIGAPRAQLSRQENTSLPFPSRPETGAYVLTNLFPGLRFDSPVAIATPPGETNRIFVAERFGRIIVVNDLANPVPEVFLDLRDRVFASDWKEDRRAEGLTSFAFHPNFAANGRFFVTYTHATNTAAGREHYNRVSEFQAAGNRRTADPATEINLINQFDEGDGHNINDAHFGPDGYLYIATGDEGDGGTGDDFNNAQKIDKDFFSALMRIDVDHRAGSVAPNPHPASVGPYWIPADNPFVGATSFLGQPVHPEKVRTEFYAVGLRNPWRFSFDSLTGAIYEGDVGQHGREEINRIVKGGNYGWSFKEGSLNGPKGPPPSGFEFLPPIWEYSTGFGPDWGFSVTGGVVSRNARLPALYGYLIYADYVSGNLWAMNVDLDPPARPIWLLGQTGIAGFGTDPRNGDVLAVNHDSGTILRLTQGEASVTFPSDLASAGIFKDLATLTPEKGIYPYTVSLPFWSDGALKRRWFSLPKITQDFRFNAESNWGLPAGAIWIKHFDLETTAGDPASRRRVETRVLVRTENRGYGLTYQWNEEGTNASLAPESGATRDFVIHDGGVTRTQIWHFPSRQQCLSCHTEAGGFALGFNTPQLNTVVTHGEVTTNQIGALTAAGFLAQAPASLTGLRRLAPWNDTNSSRTFRVKSYLAVNCAFCHQPEGSAHAMWDGRLTTPFSRANILEGALYNSVTDPGARVIAPGSLDHSAIYQRMSTLGRDRMPPIGSDVVDQNALQLLADWIDEDGPRMESYEQWTNRVFSAEMGVSTLGGEDPDGDGVSNYAEFLIEADPLDSQSQFQTSIQIANGAFSLSYLQPANRAILLETASKIPGDGWTPLNEIDFPPAPRPRKFTGPAYERQRLFRLRILEP